MSLPQDTLARLSAPFEPGEVKFKPAVVQGNRALAMAYIDARVVLDRLDEVLGPDGWQDEYTVLPDGNVTCRLSVWCGDGWLVKMDVGGPSEQPDGGDRMKAAFSDALKRAAVKWGIGRYLYRLPNQWCDYDPQKRSFTRTPGLPPSAIPRRASGPRVSCSGAVPVLASRPAGQKMADASMIYALDTLVRQRSRSKTWGTVLDGFGIGKPADFREPTDAEDAVGILCEFLTAADAVRMKKLFDANARRAASHAQAEAARN